MLEVARARPCQDRGVGRIIGLREVVVLRLPSLEGLDPDGMVVYFALGVDFEVVNVASANSGVLFYGFKDEVGTCPVHVYDVFLLLGRRVGDQSLPLAVRPVHFKCCCFC